MKTEHDANEALYATWREASAYDTLYRANRPSIQQQFSAREFGRQIYRPNRSHKINRWRKLARAIIGALT